MVADLINLLQLVPLKSNTWLGILARLHPLVNIGNDLICNIKRGRLRLG